MKTGSVEDGLEEGKDDTDDDKMKCPVPRPILNILTKKSRNGDGPIPEVSGDDTSPDSSSSLSRRYSNASSTHAKHSGKEFPVVHNDCTSNEISSSYISEAFADNHPFDTQPYLIKKNGLGISR